MDMRTAVKIRKHPATWLMLVNLSPIIRKARTAVVKGSAVYSSEAFWGLTNTIALLWNSSVAAATNMLAVKAAANTGLARFVKFISGSSSVSAKVANANDPKEWCTRVYCTAFILLENILRAASRNEKKRAAPKANRSPTLNENEPRLPVSKNNPEKAIIAARTNCGPGSLFSTNIIIIGVIITEV
jgi:hypothetical protein